MMLDDMQFVAEVIAHDGGRFEVTRVIRGSKAVVGKELRSRRVVTLERLDCCDIFPRGVVVGEKYWATLPRQPHGIGRRLDARDFQLLAHRDERARYLATVRDVTVDELRRILEKWAEGVFTPDEFANLAGSLDIRDAQACARGYYRGILMYLTSMAAGNIDHFKCDPAAATIVRHDSALAALRVVDAVAARRVPLPCAERTTEFPFGQKMFDRQIEQTKFLYPCTDSRARRPGNQR